MLQQTANPHVQECGPIWDEDFSFIRKRLVDQQALPIDLVDSAITEYRKFMSLLKMGASGIAMFSPVVDEVWHTHILFTKNYADFCSRVFGGFVHHEPNVNGAENSNPAASRSKFDAFVSAYETSFGTLPRIWSMKLEELCVPTGNAELCVPTGDSNEVVSEICVPTGTAELCVPTGDGNEVVSEICVPTGTAELCVPTGDGNEVVSESCAPTGYQELSATTAHVVNG